MPKKMTEAQIALHLDTLKATPQRIASLTENFDQDHLKTAPAPGEWSAVEILAHLRGCADVWSYTIYVMRMFDAPRMVHVHPRDWVNMQRYTTLSFAENFQAFEVDRRNLVRILNDLPFEDWARSATFVGRANTHTIFSQTMRMALHELDHCQQLETMFGAE